MIVYLSSYGVAPIRRLPCHCEPVFRLAWQSPGTTERYERQNNRRTAPKNHSSNIFVAFCFLPGDCHVASHSDAPRNDSGFRYLAAYFLLLMQPIIYSIQIVSQSSVFLSVKQRNPPVFPREGGMEQITCSG